MYGIIFLFIYLGTTYVLYYVYVDYRDTKYSGAVRTPNYLSYFLKNQSM